MSPELAFRAAINAMPGMKVIGLQNRPWQTATFAGSQIKLTVSLAQAADHRALFALAAQRPEIPGHTVADIAFECHTSGRIIVEVLTVSDQ